MTEAQQRRFYFPAWNSCAVANGWFMIKGRLREPVESSKLKVESWSEPAREMGLKVLTAATQLAAAEHRSPTADDLRRGCNVAATGKISSSELDNQQTNRVVTLFKLLTDPDNLTAVTAWLHPELSEHGSFVAYLKKQARDGTLRAIAGNAYGTKDWESLPIEKLRWLCKQLKNRAPSGHKTFYRGRAGSPLPAAGTHGVTRPTELHHSGKQYDPANAAF